MRRLGLLTSTVMIGLGVVAAVAAAKVRRTAGSKCPAKTSHVIAANTQAEIFPEPGEEGSFVLGCAYAHSKEYSLGALPTCGPPICEGVRHETLAGTVVAYEDFFTGMEEGKWYVVARDLRNGRIIRRVPTGAPLKPRPMTVGVGPVVGLVAKMDGSVAWIAQDYERSKPSPSTSEEVPYYDVYASDKSGTRLLAQGSNVSPSSLALAGSTVYWTQGGTAAATTLR